MKVATAAVAVAPSFAVKVAAGDATTDGSGGVDKLDQDGNNGCGNDDDFEDDNEGWCGHHPKPTHEEQPPSTGGSDEHQPPCSGESTMPSGSEHECQPKPCSSTPSYGIDRNSRAAPAPIAVSAQRLMLL